MVQVCFCNWICASLNTVGNRHAAIRTIESQMLGLAELFQDMEALGGEAGGAINEHRDEGRGGQLILNFAMVCWVSYARRLVAPVTV